MYSEVVSCTYLHVMSATCIHMSNFETFEIRSVPSLDIRTGVFLFFKYFVFDYSSPSMEVD